MWSNPYRNINNGSAAGADSTWIIRLWSSIFPENHVQKHSLKAWKERSKYEERWFHFNCAITLKNSKSYPSFLYSGRGYEKGPEGIKKDEQTTLSLKLLIKIKIAFPSPENGTRVSRAGRRKQYFLEETNLGIKENFRQGEKKERQRPERWDGEGASGGISKGSAPAVLLPICFTVCSTGY